MFKEYNLKRHYETKHAEKYKNLADAERAPTSKDLLAKLEKQQGCFTKLHSDSDAATRTSFVIPHKMAQNSKPFWEGEFVKECMVESAALLCPEKKEASRRTVTRRVEDIAENLEFQLQSDVGSFHFFSLALDESCDVRDTAQLLIFLLGITRDFKLTEELAAMRPMKGTTTGSSPGETPGRMDKLGLGWDRLVSLRMDVRI